jgi:tetratricopeptide (TPR) repeat protein
MAWTALGNALVAAGRGKEAVGAYDKAAVYGARYAGLFMNMGRAFAGEKLYGRAQLAFQAAAELDPISPDVDKAMDELMEQAGLGGLAYRRRRK